MQGSQTGFSKYGRPAVKLDEQGFFQGSQQEWRAVCKDQLIDYGFASAAAAAPFLGTGLARLGRKVPQVAAQLTQWAHLAARRLGIEIEGRVFRNLTNRIEKLADRIDGLSESALRRSKQKGEALAREQEALAREQMSKKVDRIRKKMLAEIQQDCHGEYEKDLLKQLSGVPEDEFRYDSKGLACSAFGDHQYKRYVDPILQARSMYQPDEAVESTSARARSVALAGVGVTGSSASQIFSAFSLPPREKLVALEAAPNTRSFRRAAQAADEEAVTYAELLLLILYLLSPESEGGRNVTEEEEELLSIVSLPPDVTEDQRSNLLRNVQALGDGTTELASLLTLEEALAAMQADVAAYQGTLDAADHEIALLEASFNTWDLSTTPGHQHVSRAVDYLLVDRRSGFEIRGSTDEYGLGTVRWLGPDRAFTVAYHEPVSKLAAVTYFKSATGLKDWWLPPALSAAVDPTDGDGNGRPDFVEWVQGPLVAGSATDPTENRFIDKTGWLSEIDTPGYTMDVCAINAEQLAVADVSGGLSLFSTAEDAQLTLVHHAPAASFGDDLVGVYCDPYASGRLLVETLDGDLQAVKVTPLILASSISPLAAEAATDQADTASEALLADRGLYPFLGVPGRQPGHTTGAADHSS